MAQEKLEIEPLRGPVDADVVLPGSKSYTNRALIIAALADGKSEISRALRSEDTHLMAEALKALNVDIRAEGATFRVEGTGGYFPASRADLFVGNSGTTARFLTAALGLGQGTYTLDGVPRMRQRPIQDLLDALSTLGVAVQSKAGNGCLPVVVHASGIEGGRTSVVGSRSSQYLTAILLAAPYAANDVEIQVKGNLNSRPYVDMTLEIMHAFGTRVVNDNYERFQVASGQCYAPGRYTVEPDASNASYFFAAAALTGGRVQVLGLRKSSAQGDVEFVRILEKMGCRVSYTHAGIQVCGPTQLSGTEVDLNLMPDTVPRPVRHRAVRFRSGQHSQRGQPPDQGDGQDRGAVGRTAETRPAGGCEARRSHRLPGGPNPPGRGRHLQRSPDGHEHGTRRTGRAGRRDSGSGLCQEDVSRLLPGPGHPPKRRGRRSGRAK